MNSRLIIWLTVLIFLGACKDKKKENAINSIKEWMGKEILFPKNSVFTILGKDTVDFSTDASGYKLVHYIDTAGCVACQLKLAEWKRFMDEVDSVSSTHTPFFFYVQPYDVKDIQLELRREAFDYPVCLDMKDEFNRLNKLSVDKTLRTFLLDKEDKIVAIGNPLENLSVKKFYLKVLTGKEQKSSAIITKVNISTRELNFGRFSKEEEKVGEVLFKNVGDNLFVIHDVMTSCGCTKADYPKMPIKAGETLKLSVTYRADKSGYFSKNLKVYGNMEESPVRISIRGETY